MKNIILILISFLFFLGACSAPSYTEQDLITSNIKITDSPYTNLEDGDNFLYAMHYIQVNFDLTNNTSGVLNLSEAKFNVCYTIERSYECTNLATFEYYDTNLTTEILEPNDTINIQLKAHVPVDAINETLLVITH